MNDRNTDVLFSASKEYIMTIKTNVKTKQICPYPVKYHCRT